MTERAEPLASTGEGQGGGMTWSNAWRRRGPLRAWYVVGLLALLYALSFLDRMILLLLVAPLSASLHLSDVDVALLFGLGFGVVYTLVGLPLAHWLDRGHRIGIVAGGVVLWSLSTAASAFATSYTALLICRSGVAIGEAVLTPAAISLVADLFPAGRRTLPTAFYSSVGVLMPSGSFVLGGFAVAMATAAGPALAMEPWRLTLLIVSAPGLLLAPFLILTAREPVRSAELASEQNYYSARQAIPYVLEHARLWGSLFVAMCLSSTVSSAFISWTTTLLVRAHGMTPAKAGYAFGMAGIADSDDAATQFRDDAARDSDLIPPVLGRSVGGLSLVVFVSAGQACLADFARRMESPVRSSRWALWTRRSRMASA